jgi:hypothetical protein
MIWRLFRREPLVVLLIATAIGLAYGALAQEDTRLPLVTGIGPLLLLLAAPNRRATLFEAALPIPARSLFLARLLFVLAVVWAPMAALSLRHPGTALGAGLVLSAASVFILTARVEQFGAPGSWAIAVAAAAACVGLYQQLGGHDVAVSALCVAAIAVRLAMVWPRIPSSFQAAPCEPRRPRAERAGAPTREINLPLVPVLRSMLWAPVVMLALAVFQAAIGMWTYAIIAACGVPAASRRSMRWLWGLPISRRTLLAITVGPVVFSVTGGYALGVWLRPMVPAVPYPVASEGHSSTPIECWRFARGATAPSIRAPWGETANPISVRMPGFVAYHPFTAPAGSSPEFVRWQFARATEAIYGQAMTEAEYRRFRKELRPLSLEARGATVIGAMVVAVALFWIFCLSVPEWPPVAGLPKPWRQAVATAVVSVAFLPIFAMDFRVLFPGPALTSVAFWNVLALRVSAALPDTPWAVVGLAVTVVVLGGLLVDWQSRTIEPGKVVETLYDRLKT